MLTFDHAEAWRLWNTGRFASRVELADHLGTSRQALTATLRRYGFKVPPRKLANTIVGPNCTCCGKEILRKEFEACSDWRKRKRCPPCREAKTRAKPSSDGLPSEPQMVRYGDSGLLLEHLEASSHPHGAGELTRHTLAMFLSVRQCERPVLKVWFGDARA